jgi:16S rRNA (uracil1498-N3)-methyltransferase
MGATLPSGMSGSIRLFVASPLSEGSEAVGTAAQAHYLAHVMRRAAGGPVRLFNGRDGEWAARIAALRGDRVAFAVDCRLREQASEADIWLAFAMLKRDATDFLVQKATELGAAALLPVATERTNAGRINLDRLYAIAREAAEQCGRLTLPAIRPPVGLESLMRDWPADRALHAAIEPGGDAAAAQPGRGRIGRRAATYAGPCGGPAGLLVGPEGGFTDRELDALRAHPFVVPVSLGPLVLRAETAAVVGLALLLAPGRPGLDSPTE